MKKTILFPVVLAVIFAATPAAALTCELLEQVDTFEQRTCRYQCVKGNGEPMRRVYEKMWMKCTTCKQTFTSSR